MPPSPLFGKAKKEWARIVPELNSAGLLTKIDGCALASYCEFFARWAEASAKIRKTGMLVKDGKGNPMINPYVRIGNDAFDRMRQLLTEFGMTPSSRSKVKAASKPEEPEGEDYFGWAEENRN